MQFDITSIKWYFHGNVIKILYTEACVASLNVIEFVLLIVH